MLGLLFLGVVALWLVCGVAVGLWAYRWKRSRWLQVLATIMALWLPLWDVVPGYFLYLKAVREIGGVHIRRTVEADGYLDSTAVLGSCWKFLKDSPFSYCENVEAESRFSSLGPLNSRAGYYEYRLARIDAPECAPYRKHLNVAVMQQNYQLGARCVVVTRRDEPVSRFEYAMGGDLYEGRWPVPPVHVGWMRVRDRLTDETIAQASRLEYRIWIMRTGIGLPFGWLYTRDDKDRPIRLVPRDAIRIPQ